ncbi:MAG: galactose oxidase-like domain-containing protein [Planctomycetota bacterium]
MLNAVHMVLIPKGPYQGMVLVIPIAPVVGKDPQAAQLPPLATGDYRAFQPYSIIDPTPVPASFRYRNYLLPMAGIYTPNASDPVNDDTEGLFCSGHTWSPFGDLIVVGGTIYTPFFKGARFTYALNLNALWGPYPTATNGWSPYADVGFWQQGPNLEEKRWYPTATLTFPLTRTAIGTPPRNREVILVSGGSLLDPALTPQGSTQPTWNTFESLIVDHVAVPTILTPTLIKDQIVQTPGPEQTVYKDFGPGVLGPDVDWFEEYPRMHLLSTGRVFFSGYAPRWASLDPDAALPLSLSWLRAPAAPFSSNWQYPRHDAPCLLFPNFADDDIDRILRIGGADTHFYYTTTVGSTPTVESIKPIAPGAAWTSEPSLPSQSSPLTFAGRYLMNAVTLPTGAIFVCGGKYRAVSGAETPLYEAFLFENGVWTSMGINPVFNGSIRDYHSTAVLLPDGRVFIGGGNGRDWDYEIFLPPYRTNPTLVAQTPTAVVFQTPPFFSLDFDAFELSYDTEFTILCNPLPTGVALDRAILMAPGSTTHHSDMAMRYVGMDVVSAGGSKLTFRTPTDSKRAPRGIYMLFLVTTSGAVSNAVWVFLP